MTREIKFRAWVRDEYMVDVELIDWQHHEPYIVHEDLAPAPTVVDLGPPEPDAVTDLKDAVLMQYTGLKDSKGVEIWEGDILRYEWDNGNKSIQMEPVVFEEGIYYAGYQLRDCSGMASTVIGNIYENPELMSRKARR